MSQSPYSSSGRSAQFRFLFKSRHTGGDEALQKAREQLDRYAASVPNHPYASFGQSITIESVELFGLHRVRVAAQYEERKLVRATRPYHGEAVPTRPKPPDSVRPWEDVPIRAEYATETYDVELQDTFDCIDCGLCETAGSLVCPTCHGEQVARCGFCLGAGSHQCRGCHGVGRVNQLLSGGSLLCGNCGGRGLEICNSCAGRGRNPCGTCRGRGAVTCSRCEGKTKLLSYSYVRCERNQEVQEELIGPPGPPQKFLRTVFAHDMGMWASADAAAIDSGAADSIEPLDLRESARRLLDAAMSRPLSERRRTRLELSVAQHECSYIRYRCPWEARGGRIRGIWSVGAKAHDLESPIVEHHGNRLNLANKLIKARDIDGAIAQAKKASSMELRTSTSGSAIVLRRIHHIYLWVGAGSGAASGLLIGLAFGATLDWSLIISPLVAMVICGIAGLVAAEAAYSAKVRK